MRTKCNLLLLLLLSISSMPVLLTSCIREELPDINVDIKGVNPTLGLGADGIVKTTIQENGVTLYADMAKADPKNLNLTVSASDGAKWSFVDVKITKTEYPYVYEGTTYMLTRIDTTVVGEIPVPKDFSETRYIKVVSEAEGLHEDDHLTQTIIDATNSGFIGWEKDGKRSKEYVEGAHLYKIWTVNLLPAGIPTNLTFDNWANITGTDFQQPYEMVQDNKGANIRTDIWSSTNASIALMNKTNPLVLFGARPAYKADGTPDVAPVRGNENKSALVLTSNDIRYTNTGSRPFLAGCCFIGEFDGSDTGALTCTHVGLPFNQLPEKLSFWYKYLPMKIEDPNDNPFGYTFNVPGIKDYIGKQDKGFIRAVLYRADGDNKWLNGESIRDINNKDVIAYAEFIPQGTVSSYTQQEIDFTYVNQVDNNDLNNWKYNLAIYFASSYDGFRFICGANMNRQVTQQGGYGEQMGSMLYIDEMEIKCK